MSTALFTKIDYNLGTLMGNVALGQIALPDLQRPFVWPNTKVRDLFDSMYRGYPVGYLLVWESTATNGSKAIGAERKQAPAQLLVIDGQQRLTSLYSVLKGRKVKRQNFKEERIPIAFNPIDERFEVADAAIRRDAKWIPDISTIYTTDSLFAFLGDYLDKLAKGGELARETRAQAERAIQKVANLTSYPFTALQLSKEINEEQVAEVFVRINSKGTPLNQADFILTLMSVFRDGQRTELEAFCRAARVPAKDTPSPFNYFLEPDPDHLLRVAVSLGFRRARLQHVYSILRGKDLETGEFSDERREAQFDVLSSAQSEVLNLTNWHEFLKCLQQAGYRGEKQISSRNAILYAYAFYLIGRRDFGVKAGPLRRAIARWFFFIALTGRYTGSPESRMEQDLADFRSLKTEAEFVAHIDKVIGATLTADFWQITLPGELATSSARSPGLFAYYAALNLLGARVLFSKLKVAELVDPAIKAKKSALERHHLFPRGYLKGIGVRSRRDINRIANYALVEWPTNNEISDQAPKDYFPEEVREAQDQGLSAKDLDQMWEWHALPKNWEKMQYSAFLPERERLIAGVIKQGFETLSGEAPDVETEETSAPETLAEVAVAELPDDVRGFFEDLLEEPRRSPRDLLGEVASYLARLEVEKDFEDELDIEMARDVGERCTRLLEQIDEATPEENHRLIQAATSYFVLDEDADSDTRSPGGFIDDRVVVEVVEGLV